MAVKTAREEHIDRIVALLKAHDLAYEDVREKPGVFFVVCEEEAVIGTGGLEIFEDQGLLRSVVIAEDKRGDGHGSALCRELETFARRSNVDRLFLSTREADGFFAEQGYLRVSRPAVPLRVRDSPAASDGDTWMVKRL